MADIINNKPATEREVIVERDREPREGLGVGAIIGITVLVVLLLLLLFGGLFRGGSGTNNGGTTGGGGTTNSGTK